MSATSAASAAGFAQDARGGEGLREQVAPGGYPLAMAHEGDNVVVRRVQGSPEMRQHLNELGFVEGAEVNIVSRSGGDVIVSVKGARIGLNRAMSMKITVV